MTPPLACWGQTPRGLTPQRIVVINPFGIGDLLFTLPLLYAIREANPATTLGLICNRRTEELAAAFPVDWRFTFEKDEFRARWRRSKREGLRHLAGVVCAVRRQRFDALIDLSLGWHAGLAGWLAGIPKRVGFNHRQRGRFLTSSVPLSGFHQKPVAAYYLDLLPLLGIPPPKHLQSSLELPRQAEENADTYLKSIGIAAHEPLLGVAPAGGTSWGPWASLKQWPPGNYTLLIKDLKGRLNSKILLIADAHEKALCQSIAQNLPGAVHLALQVPSLLTLGGILKRCHLVVGNDSGPLHLAAALGTKTVTLFGPADGSVYGPFPPSPIHRIVSKGLVCRPCYHNFRLPPCPWDNACLKTLSVSEVSRAIDSLCY